MQEAELIERVDLLFTNALARTYQCDALIDLYHVLWWAWRNLGQPGDQRAYLIKLESVVQQIKSACLRSQQNSRLTEADLAVIGQIESQFAQLEEQVKFP